MVIIKNLTLSSPLSLEIRFDWRIQIKLMSYIIISN